MKNPVTDDGKEKYCKSLCAEVHPLLLIRQLFHRIVCILSKGGGGGGRVKPFKVLLQVLPTRARSEFAITLPQFFFLVGAPPHLRRHCKPAK
jgi:hypothetical protein